MTLTAPSWREHYMPDGRPCRCTGGGAADLARWNASAGKRFNRLMQDLRRLAGGNLQYFKAAEVQRRGALHFHILAGQASGVSVIDKAALRRLAIKHGFGHEVDVQAVQPKHAGYVAKYATKAADDRRDVPWQGVRRFERVNRETGEITKGHRPAYSPTYRTWSASSAWGKKMRDIRAAQGHHEAVVSSLLPWGQGRTVWPAEADECPRRPRCTSPPE